MAEESIYQPQLTTENIKRFIQSFSKSIVKGNLAKQGYNIPAEPKAVNATIKEMLVAIHNMENAMIVAAEAQVQVVKAEEKLTAEEELLKSANKALANYSKQFKFV